MRVISYNQSNEPKTTINGYNAKNRLQKWPNKNRLWWIFCIVCGFYWCIFLFLFLISQKKEKKKNFKKPLVDLRVNDALAKTQLTYKSKFGL